MLSVLSYRKTLGLGLALVAFWIIVTAYRIVAFSTVSPHEPADVAVVLGAAVWDGVPSPVFEERIRHSLDLYKSGQVKYLIFTGGVGDNDILAESEAAKAYAINHGVPENVIFIETRSRFTFENLTEACRLMRSQDMTKALLVSDPFHMLRAVRISQAIGLEAEPAPTPTTRYETWRSKSGLLAYEVFFLSLHYVQNMLGNIDQC